MAQLRAYYYNGGDMLELVRYQKAELPKAAGCEQEILLSHSCSKARKAGMAYWGNMWMQ